MKQKNTGRYSFWIFYSKSQVDKLKWLNVSAFQNLYSRFCDSWIIIPILFWTLSIIWGIFYISVHDLSELGSTGCQYINFFPSLVVKFWIQRGEILWITCQWPGAVQYLAAYLADVFQRYWRQSQSSPLIIETRNSVSINMINHLKTWAEATSETSFV
jgi:hypothetical protein